MAPSYGEYRISVLKKDYDLQSLEGRIEYLKAATQFLLQLTPVEADAYIEKLAEGTGISEGAIRRELKESRDGKSLRVKGPIQNERYPSSSEKSENSQFSMLEKNLLKILLIREDFLAKVIPYEKAFESKESRELFERIKEYILKEDTLDIKQLVDGMEKSQSDLVYDLLENVRIAGKEEMVLEECIETFEMSEITKREREIIDMLDLADESLENAENHIEHIKKLEEELMQIQIKKNGRG